jgi:hypothetical protein
MNTATAVVLLVSVGACASSSSSSEGSTAAATTAVTTTKRAATTTSTVPGTEADRWDLASDFRRRPADNPFPRAAGGGRVWSLRQSETLERTGTYPQLTEYTRTMARGLAAWHGANDACGGLPAIGVTASRPARVCGATVPEEEVFLSPDQDRFAVVAWESPISGEVLIAAGFADLRPSCGGSVPYWIDRVTSPLASGEVVREGSKRLPGIRTPVTSGESIYFIVGPSAQAKPGCDATQLQVTIAPAT